MITGLGPCERRCPFGTLGEPGLMMRIFTIPHAILQALDKCLALSYTTFVRKVSIKSSELIWDDWNSEHIKKHEVTKAEVNRALSQKVKARKGKQGRLIVFGKTKTGRMLALVIKKRNKGYYIFSARDASRNERKYL